MIHQGMRVNIKARHGKGESKRVKYQCNGGFFNAVTGDFVFFL
jgi:hypothetical protein